MNEFPIGRVVQGLRQRSTLVDNDPGGGSRKR